MKISPVGTQLLHADRSDGRIDRQMEIHGESLFVFVKPTNVL
jgi:hypothetical protein